MTIMTIDPKAAAEMIKEGALLIDIRGADEHQREHITEALHHPLDSLSQIDAGPVIFHCKSGQRTRMNGDRLAAASGGVAYILEGGIEGWKSAGLPVVANSTRAPVALDLMRQVQLIGGSLVILSVLLGLLVSPAFLAVAGLVGAGMVHAGATGSCAMTGLLAPLPWNRHPR